VTEEPEDVEREPCPHCGKPISVTARICPFCRQDPYMPVSGGDATGGLIPYQNPAALWAYYLGVFSILPCFPLGVTALVLGLKGLKAAKERPLVKGTVHAWIGILLGGFFAFVWLVVTILGLTGNLLPR
jgi:hypothetical protein